MGGWIPYSNVSVISTVCIISSGPHHLPPPTGPSPAVCIKAKENLQLSFEPYYFSIENEHYFEYDNGEWPPNLFEFDGNNKILEQVELSGDRGVPVSGVGQERIPHQISRSVRRGGHILRHPPQRGVRRWGRALTFIIAELRTLLLDPLQGRHRWLGKAPERRAGHDTAAPRQRLRKAVILFYDFSMNPTVLVTSITTWALVKAVQVDG